MHRYDETAEFVLLYHQIRYAYVLHTNTVHFHTIYLADTKLV